MKIVTTVGTVLLLLLFPKHNKADECRYTRYTSGTLPGNLVHQNVTLSFSDLGLAKDACNLLGDTCKGVNLKNLKYIRRYTLASGDNLLFSRNEITWRKSCPGGCEYSLSTDRRGETFYRRSCLQEPSTTKNETWGNWLQWGPCSQSCGTLGEQRRSRQCLTPHASSQKCSTENYETRVCNYAKSCSDTLPNVFGVFGNEGFRNHGSTPIYSTCIRTERENRRACGNQPDAVSREICTQQMKCCYANDTVFALYGSPRCFEAKHFIASSGLITWSVWSPWTTCSLTCGIGNKTRRRICTGSLPSSSACLGPDRETKDCSFGSCPCDLNPCRNGGVCRSDDQISRGYKCLCPRNFIGKHCDFGEPRLVCGNNSIVVAFDRRLIEDQGLIDDKRYIHFQGYEASQCFAHTSLDGSQYILSIPPPIDRSCGSSIMVTGNSYSIRNKVLWRLTDQSASSTVVLLDLSCIYNKRLNKTTDLGFGIQPTVRTLLYKTSKITFHVDMTLYREADFSQNSLIRSSPTVAEGEILFVLIDLTTISLTSPENEVLVLDYCYAADTSEDKKPIYDFIVEGCSTNPTFTTVLENGITSKGKWAFRVFEWVTVETSNDVNIVCKVSVCDTEFEVCLPSCDEPAGATPTLDGSETVNQLGNRSTYAKRSYSKSETNTDVWKLNNRKTSRKKRKIYDNKKLLSDENPRTLKQTGLKDSHNMIVSKRIQTKEIMPDGFLESSLMTKLRNLSRDHNSSPLKEESTERRSYWVTMILVGTGSVIFYLFLNFMIKNFLLQQCSLEYFHIIKLTT